MERTASELTCNLIGGSEQNATNLSKCTHQKTSLLCGSGLAH